MSDAELSLAVAAMTSGRPDEAVARLEALADRGVVGAGVAFDRGVAYALRATSAQAVPGDLGRAAHAFEEALRRDPHDRDAQVALDLVRHEIAGRAARAGGRAEEVGALPMWRTLVVALPSDAFGAVALGGSFALAMALLVRPLLTRGRRLAASTIAVCGLLLSILASGFALASHYLRASVREAVVVAPTGIATPEGGGAAIVLPEGARVDVVEERATTTLVRTAKGEGWVPRQSIRALPPFRP